MFSQTVKCYRVTTKTLLTLYVITKFITTVHEKFSQEIVTDDLKFKIFYPKVNTEKHQNREILQIKKH